MLDGSLPKGRRGAAASPPLPKEDGCQERGGVQVSSRQPRDEERALVLGVRVGKLRQKSSARNCPNKGDLGVPVRGLRPLVPLAGGAGGPAASGGSGTGGSVSDPSLLMAEREWVRGTYVTEAANVPVSQTPSP